ncbi:MAG: tRNA (adenosine(37)-N6)-threonylcarbamoyltransferase complex transferase subunit TsaD [Clostridiales bacterium]|nr:tRNA (adenosine(37)-N6)-threonylcarbamoyltransferase complex transferase subunit TsaD [Clostridiales bacterium]
MYDLSEYKIKDNPVILGIESSCDETACAVIRGRQILSDCIISSASEQALYGGVVPEIASRAHTDAIGEVVKKALCEAGVAADEVDAVAVTYGAGLLGALLVGLSFAKSFAHAHNIPLIAVNHIRGHMAAAYLENPQLKPPFITLLASGGHTAILHTKSQLEAEVLGGTCDDAAGEAFDKVARVLGLPYPGGPNVQKLAESGGRTIDFPSALVRHPGGALQFSYSGLKTAVINYMHTAEQRGANVKKEDVAASFQCAAIDPLVKKTVECALKLKVQTVTAGGGVIANDYLRRELTNACLSAGITLILPEKRHCTDNAAMIASEGLNQYLAGNFAPLSINAKAQIPLK